VAAVSVNEAVESRRLLRFRPDQFKA